MFQQFFRSMSIFRLAISFLFDYWRIRWISRRRPGDRREAALERVYARSGARFRRATLRLQGLIVKVGQFLSARSDILPMAFTRELSQLQDAVPAAPYRLIRASVESELGAPLASVFAEFEETAVAAASLGQVHRAVLVGGQIVAVKVMRPGIERLARIDLAALRKVIRVMHRFTRFGKRMNILAVYTEFAAMVRQELDYRMEAEHLKRFQRQFSSDSHILVPRLYDSYISRRLLIMEFLDGAKVTEVERFEAWGISRHHVVDTLLDAFLKQMLVHGFVHVDPHPGNLLVMPDGRVGIIDFGMMSEIPAQEMSTIVRLVRAAMARDLDTVVRAVDDLGFLQPHADRTFLKRALGYMLDRITGIELKKGQELDEFLTEFQNFLHDEPVVVQAKYMFLGRAVGLLSGLVTTLAPSFQWTNFLQERVLPLISSFGDSNNPAGAAWRRRVRELVSAIAGDASAATTDLVLQQAQDTLLALFRLPTEAEHLLQKVDRGELTIRFDLDEVLWRLERQERLISRGFWLIGATVAGIASAWLHTKGFRVPTDIGVGLCLFSMFVVFVSFLRRTKRTRPRMTRRRSA